MGIVWFYLKWADPINVSNTKLRNLRERYVHCHWRTTIRDTKYVTRNVRPLWTLYLLAVTVLRVSLQLLWRRKQAVYWEFSICLWEHNCSCSTTSEHRFYRFGVIKCMYVLCVNISYFYFCRRRNLPWIIPQLCVGIKPSNCSKYQFLSQLC